MSTIRRPQPQHSWGPGKADREGREKVVLRPAARLPEAGRATTAPGGTEAASRPRRGRELSLQGVLLSQSFAPGAQGMRTPSRQGLCRGTVTAGARTSWPTSHRGTAEVLAAEAPHGGGGLPFSTRWWPQSALGARSVG